MLCFVPQLIGMDIYLRIIKNTRNLKEAIPYGMVLTAEIDGYLTIRQALPPLAIENQFLFKHIAGKWGGEIPC